MSDQAQSAILLISCPDQKGLISSTTRFIWDRGGNIVNLEQHVDVQEDVFLMRLEWDVKGFNMGWSEFEKQFGGMAERFGMRWELRFSYPKPKLGIFVSKYSHCLFDILSRHQSGELPVDIPMVISNHPDLADVVSKFGIPYHHIPVNKSIKPESEAKQLQLLQEAEVDFLVLARYMQILSPGFTEQYQNRIINIHHSFLPAFPGAKPYHSAHSRGVKIIGATSHYVTADLDAGPIIEQDIVRVSHSDSVKDFVRKGRDLEKIVLARAIWYHVQNKILVYKNKTVIFK